MPLLVRIFLFASVFIFASQAAAQERIRIAWLGATPADSPIWVMQEKKSLEKQGLQPEFRSMTTGPIALQALLANEIDVAYVSVTTLVSSRLGGADTVMILGIVRTFVDHIVSVQDITSIEQLKGKTGGVNVIGSTSELGLRLALNRLGIDPETDVKLISIASFQTPGGIPERFDALSKRKIQFTIVPAPFVLDAEKLGFRNLFDISSLEIPFWWNSVLTRESTLKAKRSLLLKFCRAMIEAIHFIKTDKEESKAIFSKNLKITDPESLERAYRAYNPVFPENLLPTPDGVKTMLDDLAPRNPKAAAADPQSFVDMSLVKEVDASGFIKQLYKK